MTDKRTRHVVLKWFSGVENPPQKTFVNNEFRFLKADGTFFGLQNGSFIHGVLFML